MKRFVLLLLFGMFFPAFVSSAYADIPARDNLILELNTNGVLSDTSGNGRTIKLFGDIQPVAATGSNISYANFIGTGQLTATLSWAAGESTPFTISTWIKTTIPERTTNINDCPEYGSGARYYSITDSIYAGGSTPTFATMGWPAGCWIRFGILPYGMPMPVGYTHVANGNNYFRFTGNGKTVHDEQFNHTVFTFKKGSGSLATDFGIQLKPDFTCTMDNGGTFDCSFLKDGGWHNLVIRKNFYKTLEFFVDGKSMSYVRDSNATTSRYFYMGRAASGGLPYNDFKGKVSGFRIYNASLTDSQIGDLYAENAVQVISVSSSAPVISIMQPNVLASTYKKITATNSSGSLYFALTTGDVCNDTLVFDDYTDLIFSSTQDNNTRVCYKAVAGVQIVFRLSDPIRGITGTNTNFEIDNIFGDGDVYKSWTYSPRPKVGDYTRLVLNSITGANFVDINGDGLVDIMYNGIKIESPFPAGAGYQGILINTGDYNFKPVYKCRVVLNGAPTLISSYSYYGDCADTNFR